ncbi:ribonuclease H-like domain-containing protein [Butyriboletus roseoflavus]|nr:ribonuclease H-like domain-containing protein [Butyriboletus roseoflavus]
MAAVARLDRSDPGVGGDASDAPSGLPLRPDFGTQGTRDPASRELLSRRRPGKIYRYTAAIVLPDRKLSRPVKHRVFELAEQTVDWQQAGMPGHVAHDSAEKLDGAPSEGGTEYALTLTSEGEVDQQILNAYIASDYFPECLAGNPVDSQALAKVLSALNLVLTAHTSQTRIKIGRDDESKKHPDQRLFFDAPPPQDIGGGLTVREGFYVSVRPAHQQLMVNVNTCHAAFYKPQNFVNAMDEYRQFVNGGIGAFGTQVRVKTWHNNHIVMIQGISRENARQHKLYGGQFGRVTIEQYYERRLQGRAHRQQTCHGDAQRGLQAPKDNANEIVHRGLDMLGFRDQNPLLESFGIHVGTEMAVVPGRVLDKPGLTYSSDAPAAIDERASWNLRGLKFAVGARLDRWAVLVIQDGGQDDFRGAKDSILRSIVSGFREMCNKCGMQVQPLGEQAYGVARLPCRGYDRFRGDAIEEIERALRSLVEQIAPELVLVMLSSDDTAIYNGLKWLCDVKLDNQYFANVALKVNMKLGGINHTLDANSGAWLKNASTMIMGMDVTHPATGLSADGTPSIVAVVASIDEHFAQYPAILALRRSKVEIERDQGSGDNILMDMFISRFELYKARNKGELPKRVILFRDGVSESQYVQVRQYELREMKRAFEHFAPYQPKLSIVVCSKRHHTRFYPTKEEDAARDGNALPGTVVDRGITPAYEFDFFLQAHGGIKGTTRSTHYFVVHDENGFNADDLERVTNDLSYMFARATKAVSLISPAYWADIACERGRCYLHKLLMGGKDDGEAKEKGKKGKKRAEDSRVRESCGDVEDRCFRAELAG